jgi:hypothetical protein
MRVVALPNAHFPPDDATLAQADLVLGSIAELSVEAIASSSTA